MAVAAPSRLAVTTSPFQYHLPTRASYLMLSRVTSDHNDSGDLQNEDKGKGKQCPILDEIDGSGFHLEHEEEMWKGSSWGLLEDSEENPRFQTSEVDEKHLEAVDKQDEDEETDHMDPIAQLSRAVDRIGQEAELIAADLAPAVSYAHNRTTSQERRFTSAFKNIWFKSKSHASKTVHDCIICQEPIQDKEVRAPCGHYYDKECIISLFQASTKDESLFPPRCCKKPISLKSVRKYLGPSLLKMFIEKSREFSTLNRVYCASPRCSQFLGRWVQRKTWLTLAQAVYTCSCGTLTCSTCKRALLAAVKHSCSNMTDKGMEDVLALGKAKGWARCPVCRTMVELNMGCHHMTCLCKAEFCYLCQAYWKSCSCTQLDETRLVAAAEERIDIQLELDEGAHHRAPVLERWRDNQHLNAVARPRPVGIRPNRRELIQAAVDDLRENHDCQHTTWRYRDGGGRCVGCYDVLDRFVFHCMGCHTIACNRCRLNRF